MIDVNYVCELSSTCGEQNWTYTCNRSVWYLSTDCHDEEDPGLGIFCRLNNLVFFEVSILHTLTVGRHPLHCDPPLRLRKEFCGRRQIRQNDQRDNSPNDRYRPKDKENVHPSLQTARNVTDGIADEPAEFELCRV